MSNFDSNTYNRDFIYTCPSKILFDNDLTLNELKIYMIVRSFMDTTGAAYPSNTWIAEKLNINRRNVINNINKLVKKGYLERIKIKGHRYLKVSISPFPEPKEDTPPVSQKTLPSDAKDTFSSVAKDTQLYTKNIISKKDKERENARARASTFSSSGVIFDNEERVSPWNRPTFEGSGSEYVSGVESDGSFEEFWELYPVKQGRKACEVRWYGNGLHFKKHEILDGLRKQISLDDRWKDGYVPNPKKYLDEELWMDAIFTRKSKGSPGSSRAILDHKSTDWIKKRLTLI